MTKTRKATQIALLSLAVALVSGHASAKVETFDPKADQLLRRMSDYLASLKNFRFIADHITEVVLENGQKIHVGAVSDVKVKRPNMLKSRRLGENIEATLFYDGQSITSFGLKKNHYATAPAPPTLDEAVGFAREMLDVQIPAGDLIVSDPYVALTKHAVGSTYLGKAMIEGIECDHVAYHGEEIDFQIWVQVGVRPLPKKYVITAKRAPQSPETVMVFDQWDSDPDLSNEKFTFVPPLGAERTEFLALGEKEAAPVEK